MEFDRLDIAGSFGSHMVGGVMAGLVARAATPTQIFAGRAQAVTDWQEGALARGEL